MPLSSQAAEPHKEALLARGVITVAVPLDGGCPVLPELAEGDTKWRAEACVSDGVLPRPSGCYYGARRLVAGARDGNSC